MGPEEGTGELGPEEGTGGLGPGTGGNTGPGTGGKEDGRWKIEDRRVAHLHTSTLSH